MSTMIEALRRRRGQWPTELALRLGGAGLLAAAGRLALMLHRWLAMSGRHPVSLSQFALGDAAFALCVAGLALVIEGPGLFRLVPVPRHSAFLRYRWRRPDAGQGITGQGNTGQDNPV